MQCMYVCTYVCMCCMYVHMYVRIECASSLICACSCLIIACCCFSSTELLPFSLLPSLFPSLLFPSLSLPSGGQAKDASLCGCYVQDHSEWSSKGWTCVCEMGLQDHKTTRLWCSSYPTVWHCAQCKVSVTFGKDFISDPFCSGNCQMGS